MTFTALGDATAISTILSNTNTLSDIHTDIAHNHTDISTMQGNVTTILGTTNTLSDIHTDVGSAIADIAAVHTHVHNLPTSFVTSGVASVQRGYGSVPAFSTSGNGLANITISSINMAKSFVTMSYRDGTTVSSVNVLGTAQLTSSTNLELYFYTSDGSTHSIMYKWEVITFA